MKTVKFGMGTAWGWLLRIAIGGAYVFYATCTDAQVTPDRTLPNNSNVTINGSVFNITGGTQAGRNLFHSFQQFSVPNGGIASFNNGLDVLNIISRVTGGSVSNIDGLIRANGAANLFFLNPSGIVFGLNAQLNVGGSFVGSTANAIQFGNMGIFSASTPNTPSPLLTINPSALLFTQINPGVITNQSQAPAQQDLTGQNVTGLRVPDGRSLLLVGGNINIDGGGLRAYGGNIELTGLAAPGSVGLNIVGNSLTSVVTKNVERADVSLNNGAEVNVRGANGGDIKIQARNLNLAGQSKLRAGIESSLSTPDSRGGNVEINATGTTNLTEESLISNSLREQSSGKTGDVNITTGSLNLSKDAFINVSTLGKGDAGNIFIQASNAVSLVGSNTGIYSSVASGAVGNGGRLNINADSLTLTDGASLGTDVVGALGTLSPGLGNGGNINIKVTSLSLNNGSQLSSSTSGQGNAGNVSIQASNDVSLAGKNTAIFSNVESGGVGKGGNINIKAELLTLTDGAQLQTSIKKADANLPAGHGDAGNVNLDVLGKVTITGVKDELSSGILSNVETGAIANGGNINIKSGSFELSNSAQLSSSTFGQGNAGSISIQASNAVSLAGKNTAIFSDVESGGMGKGGDINIKAESLTLTEGAQLQTLIRKADANLPAGRGNAGNVNLDVLGKVTITGAKDGFSSSIFSNVGTGAIGNGSNINIKSGSFELSNGAQLSSSTSGQGNAGSVNLDVLGKVTITGAKDGFSSAIFSSVETGAIGNGGNINIKSGSFELSNGAQLISSTFAQGNAGSIFIQAFNNAISLANGFISSSVQSGGVGHGGDINIQARSLSLTDDSSLFASTSGQGNAGNISIQATDLVSLLASSDIRSNVTKGAVGNSGNIIIQAGSFSLTDESQVVASNLGGKGSSGNILINTVNNFSIRKGAFVNTSSFGEGNAGKITIKSGGAVSISGHGKTTASGVASGLSGMGNGGDIEIQARSFFLSDGATLLSITIPGSVGNAGNISISTIDDVTLNNASVSAFTYSQGNAGNIAIRTGGNISISQQSSLNSIVGPNAVGSGGNIDIQGRNFSVSDRSQLATLTAGKGDAGNFKINTTGNITLTSGAQIGTDTYGMGNAGNITANAGGTLSLDGIGSNGSISEISTQVGSQQGFVGRGKAGDININARNLSITNRATLTSQSSGQGNAGDININTRSVRLDNQGTIAASTNSGDGGNINLTAADYLLLRHNSSISTTAGTAQSSGNGGNITINTPSGFIVAIENENNDITANSFNGFGGKVQINTTGIYGITPLSLQDLKRLRPLDLDSTQLLSNDITAISQQNPSLSGPVTINSVDIDPTHGLVTLPTVTENPPKLVSANCAAFDERSGGSQFIVTGRGGLPSNPDESLSSDVVWTDTRLPVTTTQQAQHKIHAAKPKYKPIAIIPATGWVFNDKGEVTLLSSVTNATSVSTPTGCPVR